METTAPSEAAVPPETTAPPETTVPPDMTEPAAVPILTVSQAWEMEAGTRDIAIQGTVVYALGTQAVLQDSTGGIRLSFPVDPGIAPGEVLLVTGSRSTGFYVSDFELLGTAALPAVEYTLLEAPENTRVLIKGAVAEGGNLCQKGFSMALTATVSADTAGKTVDAYGVILDGRFYADTIQASAETVSRSAAPEEEWNLYFGQLHAHTNLSDGLGSVEEAFQYAANVEGLDFFAVTDHSDSFDNALFGSIGLNGAEVSEKWALGKAAAEAVTDGDFVGIFGYEVSWPEGLSLGHISTFNTPGWQAYIPPEFEELTDYYDKLVKYNEWAEAPGSISQFNHPNDFYGDFQAFGNYTPAYDEVIHLLEVGGETGATSYGAYWLALDQGWHLAPSNNQNNHNGNWGSESEARTVVLAKELTEESIYEAIRSYRVYATEDSDLEIRYSLSVGIMGSILGPTEDPVVSVTLRDLTDGIAGTTVKVIANGGQTIATMEADGTTDTLTIPVSEDHSYYCLLITQPDGDSAVTAPVWVDNYEDMGIESFDAEPDQPVEGEEAILTLTLYNDENVDFLLDSFEFFEGETLLQRRGSPGTLRSLSRLSCPFPFSRETAGEVELLVRVTGTVAGQPRSYEQTLSVFVQPKEPLLRGIASARSGTVGTAYRVRGYVTAGSENPYNTFPNTLYLQDDTGGIAVTGCTDSGIELGTPMTATGVLRRQGGNLVLELTDWEVLKETSFRFTPRTMTHATAMDYAANGGELLQIEGTVVSLTKTASGKGISRFTIRDIRGDLATVMIEDTIRSGAYGTNELASLVKKGRTIRAIGLLHVDEFGNTVLRVRNCDEVVYVPPTADPTNPRTGDWLFFGT